MLSDDNKSVIIFKALSDPIRINIIRYLKNVNAETTCGKIGEEMNISKSSGSYHFKILESANLITTRKESREKYIKLNEDVIKFYITDFFVNL